MLTFKPENVRGEDTKSVGVISTWKFDHEAIRKTLSHIVKVDELPIKFVKAEELFRNLMSVIYLRFKILFRWTVFRDYFDSYLEVRKKLKNFIRSQSQRVSLKTDSWTSIQIINYMCITTHFIDNK